MAVGALAAAGWGLVAGSAFVVGGVAGLRLTVSQHRVGLLTGFGAGALIAAVAYELVDEAGRLSGGNGWVFLGLVAGSILYLLAAGYRDSSDRRVGISLRSLVVTVAPEAVIIVGSLLSGHHISAAVIGAVFLCSVPEAFVATGRLTARGTPAARIVGMWVITALGCGLAALIAYVALDQAPEEVVALVLALAGGVVLTELTTELVPEARLRAGPLAGTAAVVGFALVFGLVELT